MAVTYANGFVPQSALAPLDGQQGCFLRADAAAAWNAARAEVKRRTGIVLTVRGWNRTYAEQVTFYLQRHRLAKAGERVCCYWQGRPYKFTGTAHAAPPGTSNHGWGLAVDVNDYGAVGNFSHPRRVATFPVLAQYGWTDTEGRGAIREPWHLVWNPSSAYAVNNPVGGSGSVTLPTIPGAPAPITPEDDMSAEAERKIDAIYAAIFEGGSSMPGGRPMKDQNEANFAAVRKALTDLPKAPTAKAVADEVWTRQVSLANGQKLTVGAALQAIARGVGGTDPAAIADAIVTTAGTKLAREILDGLAARLKD